MMSEPRIAAIRFEDGEGVDRLLDEIARFAQSIHLDVSGYLQRESEDRPGCCSTIYLEEISSRRKYRISQALGRESRGCRLDPQAMAGLAGTLSSAIGPHTDLVILNRFGKGESDGQGFRVAIEKAFSIGVPVLCAVRRLYEPAWNSFTAEAGTLLEPRYADVKKWVLRTTIRQPQLLHAL